MKKTLFAFILIAGFVAFTSCNGSQEKETEQIEDQNTEEKADAKDNDDQETAKYSPKVYDIKKLNNGDKVEGFIVEKVNYIENDEYMVELSGKQKISGYFEISPMDFSIVFSADERLKSKLSVFGNELSLNGLEFSNEDEVKKELGKENVDKLQNNEKVPATIKISGLNSAGKMHSSYWNSTELLKIIEE